IEGHLLPKELSSGIVRRYIYKAIRLGVWRYLKPESRALLKALTSWRGIIRSESLKNAVKELLIHIELNTTKGKSLLYGALIALRSGLIDMLNSTTKLLYLGISYLNNPPIFRYLGDEQ
ncbi:MAG: hypothetical protein RMH84_06765, partial [Sulfolobales archaeon]|nr:hypothetical protein [Sulfolobales archaeon]